MAIFGRVKYPGLTGSKVIGRTGSDEVMRSRVVVDEMSRKLAEGWVEGEEGSDEKEERKEEKENDALIAPGARGSQICRK